MSLMAQFQDLNDFPLPESMGTLQVKNRDGSVEKFSLDTLLQHIDSLCYGLDRHYVDPELVARKVVSGLYDNVSTDQLDLLSAETAAYLATFHPDYSLLGGRLAMARLHRRTESSMLNTLKKLCEYINPKTGEVSPVVDPVLYKIVDKHQLRIQQTLDFSRDYSYDYFAFKTLERSYLLRCDGEIVERPQHMLMRVALGLHKTDIRAVIETYELLSRKYFTHASPTLFNAGTLRPQLSSCFLLTMQEDSIEGIYDTLKQCSMISKSAGGIGLSIHCIRASGAYIAGTNGTSNGLVPMLKVFNETARYVDQGGGKRKGAFAVYLEPWHADVETFLDLKKNHGKEEQRARDLFYALWIPDLFMKRVERNEEWTLMCPHECPGLHEVYGEEFEALYEKYEAEGRGRKSVKAQDLWFKILTSQIETGTPYMLYKDAANAKSNQRHLGTIKSSNLCTEIIEYTAPDEVAVCNLASIALPKFITYEYYSTTTGERVDYDPRNRSEANKSLAEELNHKVEVGELHKIARFDHQLLYKVTKIIVRNLNKIIDINFYPVPEAKRSNLRHRPVGLGVQGLADVFILLGHPFDSNDAREVNRDIFETIYFAAVSESCDLAACEGTYMTYQGSPMSEGSFQFDLWGVTPTNRWDWDSLRRRVSKYGMRNSLLVAPMPTASTSQILGNNECIEPYTSNIYTRRVLSGEFPVVNQHLVRDLIHRQLWTPELRNHLLAANGSIQPLDEIPADLKNLYKTAWELKQRVLIDMAADRGAYIDQSQSFNVFMAQPSTAKLTSMHFYGWKKGLKTGMYYLRTRAAVDAIQFTVDQTSLKERIAGRDTPTPTESVETAAAEGKASAEAAGNAAEPSTVGAVCRMEEGCLMCGS